MKEGKHEKQKNSIIVLSDEVKLVARALLPDGIDTGTKLKYEMFEYEVMING